MPRPKKQSSENPENNEGKEIKTPTNGERITENPYEKALLDFDLLYGTFKPESTAEFVSDINSNLENIHTAGISLLGTGDIKPLDVANIYLKMHEKITSASNFLNRQGHLDESALLKQKSTTYQNIVKSLKGEADNTPLTSRSMKNSKGN